MRISHHVICQVIILVPAEGGGAPHPEYSEQVNIRGT